MHKKITFPKEKGRLKHCLYCFLKTLLYKISIFWIRIRSGWWFWSVLANICIAICGSIWRPWSGTLCWEPCFRIRTSFGVIIIATLITHYCKITVWSVRVVTIIGCTFRHFEIGRRHCIHSIGRIIVLRGTICARNQVRLFSGAHCWILFALPLGPAILTRPIKAVALHGIVLIPAICRLGGGSSCFGGRIVVHWRSGLVVPGGRSKKVQIMCYKNQKNLKLLWLALKNIKEHLKKIPIFTDGNLWNLSATIDVDISMFMF